MYFLHSSPHANIFGCMFVLFVFLQKEAMFAQGTASLTVMRKVAVRASALAWFALVNLCWFASQALLIEATWQEESSQEIFFNAKKGK